MNNFVIRVLLTVLLATMACHGSVQAFYVEGLMSGMSSTTVEKILLKRGYEVTEVRDDGSIVARNIQENGPVVTAFFCDDRLMQVRIDFEPKFSRFVELVEKKRKELGIHASARVVSSTSGAEATGSSVIFTWMDEATTIEVVYVEKGLSPQVSLFHRVKSSCR